MAIQPDNESHQQRVVEDWLKKNFSDAGDLRRERGPAPVPVENKVPPPPAQDNSQQK